jgi:uncharacterized metal-binding protein YceD (DUF177 family)
MVPGYGLTIKMTNPTFAGVLEIDPRDLGRSSVLRMDCSVDRWESFDQEVRLASPLQVEVNVSSTGSNEWLLVVSYHGTRHFECSRTTKPFVDSFNGNLQLFAVLDPGFGTWILDDSEDEVYHLRYGAGVESFDIAECVRQDILINEPLQPLADPQAEFVWKREEIPTEEPIDPRWTALKGWKEQNVD